LRCTGAGDRETPHLRAADPPLGRARRGRSPEGRLSEPLVSINLCCYNSERFLEETLQSVFAQTFTDWELVVINDGSKDSTDAIVRRHIAAERRIVYHPQANAGLGAARNKAIELSRGRYIAIIDHDDLWAPQKLERLIPLFDRAEVGLVYSNADYVDARGAVTGRYTPAERMFRGRVLAELFLGNFVACSTVLMRRAALDEVGFFRPDLHIAEEYELFLRLAERYDVDCIDEPMMQYRLHDGNASWNVARAHYEVRDVLKESVARVPELERMLGRRTLRLRFAGFTCSMRQAHLLDHPVAAVRDDYQGRLGAALRELPKPLLAWMVSLLPPGIRSAAQRLIGFVRRKRVTP
jgi:glycosyltransferase involved in cell wall biosynthesis